ncbi:hypothetical protein L6164_000955 [Bauhinia variegata]|uniref:Uncharacterized protein n=1 Tax=Bauhinia variegata TaxID=167791 RepID=A0ACB9Q9F1_BAUVA|nr:hypothetical protein L6164_000955 [Bauhinia variegata]
MGNLLRLHSSFSFLCFLLLSTWVGLLFAVELIPIGVVLDTNSSVGTVAQSCISMARSDFYERHPNYRTKLDLRIRDSENDVVTAASAALDLIENERVHAIIGPQTSEHAKFIIELGAKAKIPIISFSATSPTLYPTRNQFFIRTAQDDCSQVKAIASIIGAFGWREIVPIYENTEYGKGLIPCLNDAFEAIDTRVPYRSVIDPRSYETQILEELHKITNHTLTKIFLVHMTKELGSKFFPAAEKAGMMTEGYAWIVTEGLSSLLDPMEPEVINSMQGVLGVRPRVPNTTRVEDFRKRWNSSTEVTLFGLWAYDTVWALAMAVEKAGITNSTSQKKNDTNNSTGILDFADVRISETGPRLLNEILTTKFRGLSGDFSLVNGTLEPSRLEIFNVREQNEYIIGYRPKEENFPDAKLKLQDPKWPGNAKEKPTKLRIGIPGRENIKEYSKVVNFSFDIFDAVVKNLTFPLFYEFHSFGGTYDELLMQIQNKTLDAVVGDIIIVANRSNNVDFTLPFSESSVAMVVSVKHDERNNIWIFLKPLSWGLWLTIGAAFMLTGFIIWILEHRTNTEFRGGKNQQLGMIFWFSFSTLVFAHKERVVNNWSRFVLIVWVLAVLIITQSYAGSLASILTVQRLQPAFLDVNEIKRNNYSVGYQNGSFLKGFLIAELGFNESKLKPCDSPEDYHHALLLGCKNGAGVAAIFGETFFLNLFLQKYGSRYKMVGPTYNTGGFGFAFPKKSPLVSYISRAILEVTEDKDKFGNITKKYFPDGIVHGDQSDSISSDCPSLTLKSFGGDPTHPLGYKIRF